MTTHTQAPTRRRPRSALLVTLLLVLALVAAACGGGSDDNNASNSSATTQAGDTGGGKVTRGGTLRFGIEADVATLDPAGAINGPAPRSLVLAIYDPLLTYDKGNKLVPYL